MEFYISDILPPQYWEFCSPDLYNFLVLGAGFTPYVPVSPLKPGSVIVLPCDESGIHNVVHWTLMAVFFPTYTAGVDQPAVVLFFDSAGKGPTHNHLVALQRLREQLRTARRVPVTQLWRLGIDPVVISPQQLEVGTHDSGVLIMAVARAMLAGDPWCVPERTHIPGLRVLLAAETLIGMRLPVTYFPETIVLGTARKNKLASLVAIAGPDEVCNAHSHISHPHVKLFLECRWPVWMLWWTFLEF